MESSREILHMYAKPPLATHKVRAFSGRPFRNPALNLPGRLSPLLSPKLISHKPLSNCIPRSAANLDIKIHQAATTPQHPSDGIDILFFSGCEVGHCEIDGCPARFLRDLYIRPGSDHGGGINERSNRPAMHDSADGDKRLAEWEGKPRHP